MNRYMRLVAQAILRANSFSSFRPTDEEVAAAHHLLGDESKRQTTARTTAAVRDAVFERAAGRCEAFERFLIGRQMVWRRCSRSPIVMDHWLGGSGRRKPMESVETCWALCGLCNTDRTANDPNAAYWNIARAMHDQVHGYEHHPHIEHQPVRRMP